MSPTLVEQVERHRLKSGALGHTAIKHADNDRRIGEVGTSLQRLESLLTYWGVYLRIGIRCFRRLLNRLRSNLTTEEVCQVLGNPVTAPPNRLLTKLHSITLILGHRQVLPHILKAFFRISGDHTPWPYPVSWLVVYRLDFGGRLRLVISVGRLRFVVSVAVDYRNFEHVRGLDNHRLNLHLGYGIAFQFVERALGVPDFYWC